MLIKVKRNKEVKKTSQRQGGSIYKSYYLVKDIFRIYKKLSIQ